MLQRTLDYEIYTYRKSKRKIYKLIKRDLLVRFNINPRKNVIKDYKNKYFKKKDKTEKDLEAIDVNDLMNYWKTHIPVTPKEVEKEGDEESDGSGEEADVETRTATTANISKAEGAILISTLDKLTKAVEHLQ